MGISLIHTTLELLLIGAFIRTITYMLLERNPDNRLGKFLAYSF
jgi:hypothetical protein